MYFKREIRNESVMEAMKEMVEQDLGELRETFASRRTRSMKWRKRQLSAIIKMVKDKEDEICEALFQDLGKHHTEAYRDELGVVKRGATTALNCLDQWVLPRKVYIKIKIRDQETLLSLTC